MCKVPPLEPLPALPSTQVRDDDIEQFFSNAKKPIMPMGRGRAEEAAIDAEIEATLAAPLDFADKGKAAEGVTKEATLDIFGPTLARPNPVNFNCRTPTAASMVALQLGEVTEKVCHLELEEPATAPHRLFTAPSALLPCHPPNATLLRPRPGLGLLGPKEKMTAKPAEALIRRFDEPLTEDDISIIAKLTRLNKDALRVAVGMAGPDAAAEEAVV
ncbi:hypothetical protein VPH35_014653 [Triticum aestivum]